MKWDNLTVEQSKVLNISGNMEKAVGYFRGLWFAAQAAGNKDAADTAFEMYRDASTAHTQFIEMTQGKE